jgi:CRP-like cAMP-binding protein
MPMPVTDLAHAQVIPLAPAMSVRGVTMHFARKEEIYGEGEEATFLYKVISGVVRTCAFDANGRRLIEGFYLPGEIFGLEQGETHTFSAEAVCDATIAAIPRAAIARATDSDRTAAVTLWNITAQKLANTHQHLIMLGKKSAAERVAAFLLHIAGRLGGAGVTLPMSRTDIADYLGLTIETVSRTFSKLERDRTISLDGARQVKFNNVAQLQAAA